MYIENLPTELILKILEYLPQDEIPQLIYTCSRFKEVVTQFPVNGTLNLSNAQLLTNKDIKQFFHKTSLAPTLRKLLLNEIWWFDFSKLIIKCQNLVTVQMIDIHITSSQMINIFQSCLKLHEIEITWPESEMASKELQKCEVLRNLQFLKIQVSKIDKFLHFLHLIPNLIRVHIYVNFEAEFEPEFIQNRISRKQFENISLPLLKDVKLVYLPYRKTIKWIQLQLDQESKNSKLWNLVQFYLPRIDSNYGYNEMELEKSCIESCKVLEVPIDRRCERIFETISFQNMKDLSLFGYTTIPITALISSMIHLRSIFVFVKGPYPLSLDAIKKFHPLVINLGFQCYEEIHSSSYVYGELETFCNLKYLCVPPCVLIEKIPLLSLKSPLDRIFHFKKPRIGEVSPDKKADEAAFNKVLDKGNELEVLEIAKFRSIYGYKLCELKGVHWHCLANIKKLSNLTVLTLEFIPISSGFFFASIAEGCQKLRILRLKDLGPRGKCSYMKELGEALPLFKSLDSFRIEDNYILPGRSLFDGLNQCPKLKRVAVFSLREDMRLDDKSFFNFIQKKSLSFAFFVFEDLSMKIVSTLNKIAKEKKSEYLFLRIYKELSMKEKSNLIPLKHYLEMVIYGPWFAVR